MHVILVPGFWLPASSWDAVTGPLVVAGHTVEPVTLPGAEPVDPQRADVSLADRVHDVVARVDSVSDIVVLVGHSAGGAIVHAAVDARPDHVARAIYVDCMPLASGRSLAPSLPVVDGEILFPGWDAFDESELHDLTPALRETFEAQAVPVPARVARDVLELHDERRYDVPATVIACELSSSALQAMAQDDDHPWHSYVEEISLVRDVTWNDLPTGHWPQLTRSDELAALLLAAVHGG